MHLNLNSTPKELYDLPAPGCPGWMVTRNAIEKHRAGERPPVAILRPAEE